MVSFQFTTSQGGRRLNRTENETYSVFQFTTSQGGRRLDPGQFFKPVKLSIHDLTRRSTMFDETYIAKIELSIHDLTRRSTTLQPQAQQQIILSIHDLTRRSTISVLCGSTVSESFNSRPHKEVDLRVSGKHLTMTLSIHDLTRRSTKPDVHRQQG